MYLTNCRAAMYDRMHGLLLDRGCPDVILTGRRAVPGNVPPGNGGEHPLQGRAWMTRSTTCDGRGDRGAHEGRHPSAWSGQVGALGPPLTLGTVKAAASGDTQKRQPVAAGAVQSRGGVIMAPSPPCESLRAGPGTKTGGGRCICAPLPLPGPVGRDGTRAAGR